MTTIPYWHVDAFAERPFTGNQAAVMMLDDWLDDATLQAIGAENMFAETAFLVRDTTDEADWELRWVTPDVEIRLCGHATLASGHVLLAQDASCERVTFRTRQAGVLEVRRAEQALEVGLPTISTSLGSWPQAVAALNADVLEVWRSADEHYNVFLLDDEDAVRRLAPDIAALGGLGEQQFIVTAPGRESDVVSRVFVPGAGVPEDSVTGSAHAVLTPFWANKLGRETFTAFQASVRGGHLTCRRDGAVAWLGGPCVTVVEGRFNL